MGKVPCKSEGSHKRARTITMTTIWVAPTRYPHTENLSGEKCADTYQKTSKGKEGLGATEAKATCTARESNVSEVIDWPQWKHWKAAKAQDHPTYNMIDDEEHQQTLPGV